MKDKDLYKLIEETTFNRCMICGKSIDIKLDDYMKVQKCGIVRLFCKSHCDGGVHFMKLYGEFVDIIKT